jgi:enoyl-CoA hydratase/carnithine racemase
MISAVIDQQASDDSERAMPDRDLVEKTISGEERIAWLTLNRPEKKNALSADLMRQLISHIKEINQDPNIRVIVLSGNGDSFCSGLDLYDLRAEHKRERRWGQGGNTQEIVQLLRLSPQITIAAVQGYCLGGGLVLANGCDLAVATETAQLGMPEILRGSYGAVATPTLFHAGLPTKLAFQIQLTGRNLNGLEAARVGLVSQAVPESDLKTTVANLAGEIASRHRITLAHAKIAAYAAMDLPFVQALQVDELVSHRMRYYMDPLDDVDNYLNSQKGGTNRSYKKPNAND